MQHSLLAWPVGWPERAKAVGVTFLVVALHARAGVAESGRSTSLGGHPDCSGGQRFSVASPRLLSKSAAPMQAPFRQGANWQPALVWLWPGRLPITSQSTRTPRCLPLRGNVSRAPVISNVMPQTASGENALAEAKALSQLIAQHLPERVEAAALSFDSKLPFKALSLRELLVHRMAELAGSAVDSYECHKTVAGAVLTRSIVETVAVTFALHRALARFVNDRDVGALDQFLTQSLLGSRWPDSEHRATNILTLIQHVEKVVPGFEASYDALSEVAHPNWSGVLGSFGEFDRKNLELALGPRAGSNAFVSGTNALSGALLTFHHFYNDMVDMLYDINSYFELKGGSNAA